MDEYRLKLINELEQLIYNMQKFNKEALDELIIQLNRKKIDGCPIENDHIVKMLNGRFDKNIKYKEALYMDHAENCPVCFTIGMIKVAQLEIEKWTLDYFRSQVLRQMNIFRKQ